VDTQQWFARFAAWEAAGTSPTYERLARAVSESAEVLQVLAELPGQKRQPSLLLASARLLGAPIDDPPAFVSLLQSSWSDIKSVMLDRSTQTNEAARTGTFLPVLAELLGPLTLIEVGCSGGLCLYPNRYSISYNGQPPLAVGSPVHIDVATNGLVPLPTGSA